MHPEASWPTRQGGNGILVDQGDIWPTKRDSMFDIEIGWMWEGEAEAANLLMILMISVAMRQGTAALFPGYD